MGEFLLVLLFLLVTMVAPLAICVLIIIFYMLFSLTGKVKKLEANNNTEINRLSGIITSLGIQVNQLKRIVLQLQKGEVVEDEEISALVSKEVSLEKEKVVVTSEAKVEPVEAAIESIKEEIVEEKEPIQEPSVEIQELDVEASKLKTAREKEGFFFKDNIEAYIGGRLLNRIGALALIIGIAFFLKYAFDQNWISETVRVLIGTLLGGGLLYGGWVSFKKDFMVFSQGLVGAGIGTLYLSFYAAYNFYHIIPYPVAVLLMAVVTVLALGQALYYNSMAIATLGLIGGFLTPFVLPVDDPSAAGLFVYLIFLNIAVIALLLKRDSWRFLELSSIIITFIVYIAWAGRVSDRQEFITSAMFLTLLWLMYYSLGLSRILKRGDKHPIVSNITNIILLFFYYINMLELVDYYYDGYHSTVSFTLMLVCLATAILVQYQYKDQRKVLGQFIVPAILLLVIATEQEYSGYITVMLYSFEALGIVALGVAWKRNYIWLLSYLVFALALLKLTFLVFAYPIEICEFVAILNKQAAAFLVLIGTMGMATITLQQNVLVNYKNAALGLLRTVWIALTFIFIGMETSLYFDKLVYIARDDYIKMFAYCKPIFMSLLWVIYSLQLIRYGLANKYLSYKVLGTIAFVIASLVGLVAGSSFEPLTLFSPLVNVRFLLFIVIVVSLITIERWVEKYLVYEHDKAKAFLIPLMRYSWAIVLFILFTVEVNDYFNYLLMGMEGGSAEVVTFYRPLALSIIWTFFALGSIQHGLTRDQKGYIIIGFIILFFALLFSVVIGFTFYPIEYYIPIANMRFVAIAVVVTSLIVIISWLKKTGTYYPWCKVTINVLRVMTSLFLVLLLTYEAMDLFNKELNTLSIPSSKLFGTVNDSLISYYNNLKQLSLSVLWLVYSISLMVFGIAKRIKVLRITAICFFSIAILKIFCYDLRFLETLYRIFSFIGLGVIALSTSYLYQRYKDVILGDEK